VGNEVKIRIFEKSTKKVKAHIEKPIRDVVVLLNTKTTSVEIILHER